VARTGIHAEVHDRDDSLGPLERERLEDEAVEHAEDRRARSDTERQCHDAGDHE
jgi:hypothetical protein